MKCKSCGYENKDGAKFCTNCGEELVYKKTKTNTNKANLIIILITIVVIAAIIGVAAYMIYGNNNSDETYQLNNSNDSVATEISNSQASAKEWKSIGSFSGSGTGSKTISIPAGQIRIDLTSFPIKNYADNHLYVSGSNGESAALDWNSHSDVASKSDSISFISNSQTTFTIDYYETVSWNVEVYKYQ